MSIAYAFGVGFTQRLIAFPQLGIHAAHLLNLGIPCRKRFFQARHVGFKPGHHGFLLDLDRAHPFFQLRVGRAFGFKLGRKIGAVTTCMAGTGGAQTVHRLPGAVQCCRDAAFKFGDIAHIFAPFRCLRRQKRRESPQCPAVPIVIP